MLDVFGSNFNNYFFGVTKIFFISLSFLYLIFALITIKQVTSMSKNITDKFNTILIIFSFIHLIFSVILVLSMFAL